MSGGSNAASPSFDEIRLFVLRVGEAALEYGSSAPCCSPVVRAPIVD